MAILANRSKISSTTTGYIRFVLAILKRSLALLLIIISLNLLYFSTSKKLSSYTMEIAGSFVSTGLLFYEITFEQLNYISNKFKYFGDIEAENIELKLELAKLKKLQNNIQLIQAENLELRKLLRVVEEPARNYITARLLTISINPFGKTALINAGISQGAKVDQIVTNSEGLIGRIIEVSKNYSKVMLITDFNSRIPVITGHSRERGILAGDNNFANIIYLQANHNIEEGEKIFTSGDGKIHPTGIEVAEVIEVSKKAVKVKPVVNFSQMDFVQIFSPD